jgi:GT2 family glycosyltransferase
LGIMYEISINSGILLNNFQYISDRLQTEPNMNQPAIGPQDSCTIAPLHPDVSMETELSIVIGTRNRKEILEKCLNALIGKIQTSHQIIVIDAGSTDGTIQYLENITEIHLICDGEPIGQAQSFNRVFPALKCRFICWISDDNVVQPGILDTAVKILQNNQKIGLVALKVKDVAGPHTGPPYTGGIKKTGILNCNQGVIRSDLFKNIGYFDESFKNYGIDYDLTTKVLLAGYRVVYTKTVAIHHFRDHDSEDGAIAKAERTKNRELLKKEYYDKYSYLMEYRFLEKHKMRGKKVVWSCIKQLNRLLEKRGLQIESITGKNMKDWENLTKVRHISIFDIFYNRNNPYYLEQHLPKKFLLSKMNPYKKLIE